MCLVILLALSIVVKRKRLSFEFHKKILNRWRNENSKIPFSINIETHQKALTYDSPCVTQQSTFLYYTNQDTFKFFFWMYLAPTDTQVKHLDMQNLFLNNAMRAKVPTGWLNWYKNRVIGYTHIFIRNLVTPQALRISFVTIKITKRTRKFKKVLRKF